ncbi:STAS domain-containing protein [Amycolatopsis azurea]|uniref:Anti-sigma factor antagonist n=1 Tax=Amycolatopsis azurea DSM 43854 TaxID=1238180 RepID=A0ABX3J0G0_9PSEU|nr:STAS domain-containing protein [Amycolatopsis azurea]OOC00527.1 anti-anti-sigma factor [Amycolatopsis azurea DSM 43854]
MKLITLDLRRSRRPRPSPEPLDEARTVMEFPAGRGGPPVHLPPPLTVTVKHLGRTVVLAVDGDVDLHTAPVVQRAIESVLGTRPRRLVVDLTLVRFLNSSGLEVLLAAHRRAGRDTDLRLVATTRAVWRPLQVTRLHEQLIIHASLPAAIAAPSRTMDEDRATSNTMGKGERSTLPR